MTYDDVSWHSWPDGASFIADYQEYLAKGPPTARARPAPSELAPRPAATKTSREIQ